MVTAVALLTGFGDDTSGLNADESLFTKCGNIFLNGVNAHTNCTANGVSSQVKWAKFRHKVYQFWGEVSPGSIPAEKLVSNGLVVLQSVAGAGHVNDLAAVDEAVKDSGGNGGVAEEVGPLVKTLVGSNDQ